MAESFPSIILVAKYVWYIALIEYIGILTLFSIFHYIGIPIYRTVLDLAPPTEKLISEKIVKCNEGKFRFTRGKRCFFASKPRFSSFRWHTPFPLKGIAKWKDSKVIITGLMPIGTTLFFLLWLAGWTIGYVITKSPYMFIGYIGAFIIIGTSIPTEISRMKTMVSELSSLTYTEDE